MPWPNTRAIRAPLLSTLTSAGAAPVCATASVLTLAGLPVGELTFTSADWMAPRLIEVNAGSRPLDGGELLDEDVLPDTGINRYQMQLQLEGSYLATLRYLRALEGLPWKFFWEGVEYEVTEHPTARITIDLYTLGLPGDA